MLLVTYLCGYCNANREQACRRSPNGAALASILAVKRLWGILPSATTLLRSFLLSTLAYISAAVWAASGILLLVKLPAISAPIYVAYFILGEFSAAEMDLIRSILDWPGRSRTRALEAE